MWTSHRRAHVCGQSAGPWCACTPTQCSSKQVEMHHTELVSSDTFASRPPAQCVASCLHDATANFVISTVCPTSCMIDTKCQSTEQAAVCVRSAHVGFSGHNVSIPIAGHCARQQQLSITSPTLSSKCTRMTCIVSLVECPSMGCSRAGKQLAIMGKSQPCRVHDAQHDTTQG